MAVYVDPLMDSPMSKKWHWPRACHMYADTEAELHAFARRIGLKREWCSDRTQPGSILLHYDLNPSRRKIAVAAGAVEVDHAHGRAYYRTPEERKAEVDRAKARSIDDTPKRRRR